MFQDFHIINEIIINIIHLNAIKITNQNIFLLQ